jgi:prepilin peptidase CpaA
MLWFYVAAIVAAAAGAWIDWRTGTIPNGLTFGVIAAGPVVHLFATLVQTGHRVEAAQDAGLSALGAVVCGVLPLGLWRAGGLGGGDLKLFVGLGALLLPMAGLEAELWSFCAAAFIAPIGLAWNGRLFQTVTNATLLLVNPFLPKERRRELDREQVSWFRMGPAILVGTAVTAYLHRHG